MRAAAGRARGSDHAGARAVAVGQRQQVALLGARPVGESRDRGLHGMRDARPSPTERGERWTTGQPRQMRGGSATSQPDAAREAGSRGAETCADRDARRGGAARVVSMSDRATPGPTRVVNRNARAAPPRPGPARSLASRAWHIA